MVDVKLHRVCLRLTCDAPLVQRDWQRLFAGWLADCGLGAMANLQLGLGTQLGLLPQGLPFFVDADGLLSVYGTAQELLLHFSDGALVTVPLEEERPFLSGQILEKALAYGRLEDITFTALAPFLRRQGYFLIHGFGACRDGECLLIVGASGSGKTTTGLSLLLAGWQLLANDILLLEARPDGVYALPTPGGLGVREGTLALLPECQRLLADERPVMGRYDLTNQQIWQQGQMPEATRITAVYFCQIEGGGVSEKRPLSPALTLVQLMEQSVDRWDQAMLPNHINLLQQLSQQANCFRVHLGHDVGQLPSLLASKR